jgi:hypothetical protein
MLNAGRVTPQDLPLWSAAIQRRPRSSGDQVHPDPIWAARVIWRPQDQASRPPRPAQCAVHLPQRYTTHPPWLPATEEDRPGA